MTEEMATQLPIAICITAYNEADNLDGLFGILEEVTQKVAVPLKVTIVDNGSTDQTGDLCRARSTSFPLEVVTVWPNRLYGGGMSASIAAARADVVCMIPADNQYGAKDIARCIERYVQLASSTHCVTVKGRRSTREDPLSIRVMSWMYSTLVRVGLGLPKVDVNGLPKVFDRRLVLGSIDDFPRNAVFDAAVLAELHRHGSAIREFDVTFANRRAGSASWSGKRLRVASTMLLTVAKYSLTTRFCRNARSAGVAVTSPW